MDDRSFSFGLIGLKRLVSRKMVQKLSLLLLRRPTPGNSFWQAPMPTKSPKSLKFSEFKQLRNLDKSRRRKFSVLLMPWCVLNCSAAWREVLLSFTERLVLNYALSKCVYGWISLAPTLAICKKVVASAETRPKVSLRREDFLTLIVWLRSIFWEVCMLLSIVKVCCGIVKEEVLSLPSKLGFMSEAGRYTPRVGFDKFKVLFAIDPNRQNLEGLRKNQHNLRDGWRWYMFGGFLNQSRHDNTDMNIGVDNFLKFDFSNAQLFGWCADSKIGASWGCAQPGGFSKSRFSGLSYAMCVWDCGQLATWEHCTWFCPYRPSV